MQLLMPSQRVHHFAGCNLRASLSHDSAINGKVIRKFGSPKEQLFSLHIGNFHPAQGN